MVMGIYTRQELNVKCVSCLVVRVQFVTRALNLRQLLDKAGVLGDAPAGGLAGCMQTCTPLATSSYPITDWFRFQVYWSCVCVSQVRWLVIRYGSHWTYPLKSFVNLNNKYEFVFPINFFIKCNTTYSDRGHLKPKYTGQWETMGGQWDKGTIEGYWDHGTMG